MTKVGKKVLLEYDPNDMEDPEDCDLSEMIWDCFVDAIQDLMTKRLKTEYLKVDAENVGWRHLSGYKYINTDDAETLLQEILSSTDCVLSVRIIPKGIYINAKHHDNPVNGDHYFIKSVTERTYNRYA